MRCENQGDQQTQSQSDYIDIYIFITTCESSRFGPLIIKSVVKTAGRLLRPSCRPSYWSLLAGHVNIDLLPENILLLVVKQEMLKV